MTEVWGDRNAALVRELTKIHQEAIRGRLSEIAARLAQGLKGEMALVVDGAELEPTTEWEEQAEALAGEGHSMKTIVQEIVGRYDVPKNLVKDFLLKIRKS
jgi:16S rRNA (cytidine1402-2'-O)-methyltransferase